MTPDVFSLINDALSGPGSISSPEPHAPTIRKALKAARRELLAHREHVEFRARQLALINDARAGEGADTDSRSVQRRVRVQKGTP